MRATILSPRSGHSTIRAGFTLIEMLMAITLTLAVFATVVPFLRLQSHQLGMQAGYLDALQNARYAQNQIDRELRMAGEGVVSQQSMIVLAAPMAVVFNADLQTTNAADPSGVYYNPYADTMATTSLTAPNAVTLPTTAFVYPSVSYQSTPGVSATAQTVMYWLSHDSTSSVATIYVLWRQVNNTAPTAIATNINVPAGTAVFQYYKKNQSTGLLDSIPSASLPYFHSAAVHGSAADTGNSARTDSIVAVGMTLTGMFQDPNKGPIYRTVTTMTKLLNAGLLQVSTCGQTPLPVTPAPVATPYLADDSIVLTFNASIDQDAGEKSVDLYNVYKAPVGAANWGDPITTFAAGTSTYHYQDTQLGAMHGSWQYAVVAQDCTPTNSAVAVSNTVTLP